MTSMKTLCQQSIRLSGNYNEETSVQKYNEYIRDEILALHNPYWTEEIALNIKQLWQDIGIQTTFKRRHYFEIADNIEYFFNKIDDICSCTYCPDFEDSVRISRPTIGCSLVKFISFIDGCGEYEFAIPDVSGSRAERKKWWR
eukprot:758117_1